MLGIALEAKLGQCTHDIDQAVLDCIFQIGMLATHDAPADGANQGRDCTQELANRQGVTQKRRPDEVIELASTLLAPLGQRRLRLVE